MQNLWPKIRKLLTALNMRGEIYMVNREQIYSHNIGKVCTIMKLNRLTPIDQYFKEHPDKKRRKDDNREHVKETITSSFRDVDILLKLVDIYKAGEG